MRHACRAAWCARLCFGAPWDCDLCVRFADTRAAASPCDAVRDAREEAFSVLGRPGSDLLFQVLRLSTIGAGEFNGRVRDGIGFLLPARTTRPAKDGSEASW